ncbi:MAG: hypothetical protein CMJ65_08635 [Planctomycetaceae bacterium]|nr:hypothetical protein [Planctomycetaceae bacterium]
MIGSRLSRQAQTPPWCFLMTVVIAVVMAVGCEQSAPVNSAGSPGTSNPDLSTDVGGDAASKTTAKVPDEIPVVTPTPELPKQLGKPDPTGDNGRPQPPATSESPGEPVGEKPENPPGQVNSPPPVKPEKPVDPETTAEALLELSQEFLDAKDTKQARFWLEHITREFPKTKAAARAAALLKTLAG